MPPKELDEKVYFLIKCAALCFALVVALSVFSVVTNFVPADSFLSGLKIRWWLAAVYVFLPLGVVSLGLAFFINKKLFE